MQSKLPQSVQGSNSAYLGIGLIVAVIAGIGYSWDSNLVIYAGAALMAGLGTYGWVFSRAKEVLLLQGGVGIKRGSINSVENIHLSDVKSISLSESSGKPNAQYILPDIKLEEITDWKPHNYIVFELKNGKTISLHSSDFSDVNFILLAKTLKEHYLNEAGTPLQKISRTRQKTLEYIAQDKQLRADLRSNLLDAYNSVYQLFEQDVSKTAVQLLQQDAEVAFFSITHGNKVVYYKHGQFKPQANANSIAIAQKLIDTAQHNLDIVEKRLTSHEEVKEKLDKIAQETEHRVQLNNVANQLNALQQQNIGKSIFEEGTGLEAEIIVQLQALSASIHEADTLERVNTLHEQIKLLKE